LAENSIENYQEYIRLFPHDPLCDRIRDLLASLVQAKAWHNAVLANSPVAYKSFYDKFSNSPYAQTALKLEAQPKLVPLSQPVHIIAPPSIKLGGGLGGGLGSAATGNSGADKFSHGGQIVTLPVSGTPASSGNNGVGKIVELPAGGLNKTAEQKHSKLNVDKLGHGGQIVTLPSGTSASSGNNGAGKIIDMPHGGLNKTGAPLNSKLNAEVTRFDDRPAKPLSHIDQQSTGVSRSNIGTPPVFRQGPGATNAGSNLHVASGPAFQSQARFGSKFAR
jgi:hypothetical protein